MLRRLIIALALLAGWLFLMAFQLAHLSHFLDHDIVAYLEHVKKHVFFNPHHLLFTVYGRAIAIIAVPYWSHTPLFLLQCVHLAIASFTLMLALALLAWRSTWLLALALACNLAFLRGFWFYSQVYDTPILPICLSLWTFFFLAFFPERFAILRGIFGAVLLALTLSFHQRHFLLFLPAMLLFLLPQKNRADFSCLPFSRRLFAAALCMILTVSAIALLYFYAGVIFNEYPLGGKKVYLPGVERGGNFFDWLFLYSHYSNT